MNLWIMIDNSGCFSYNGKHVNELTLYHNKAMETEQ